jgi:hypothetical protein
MTSVNITTTQNTVTVDGSGEIAVVTVKTPGQNGAGVDPGGAEKNVLVKSSAATYDTEWTSQPEVGSVRLDPAQAVSITEIGQISWSDPDKCIGVKRSAAVTECVGQDIHVYVKCVQPGGMIKGQVAMFVGADQSTGRIEVGVLVADGTYPGYVFLGILAEDIAENNFGFVCTNGYVRGIDTSIYPPDSLLWACTVNPGDLVLEENLLGAPNLKLPVAVTVQSDAVNGEIFVRATTGNNLYLLHDVEIDGGETGDLIAWNDDSQRWENQAPAARSATVAEPVSGDSFTLFRTARSTTLREVTGLVSGGSVTYEIRYSADRTATGSLAIVADTVTNTTTGSAATIQNQPIPTGNWVWLEITAVVGTVDEFNASLAF